MDEEKNINISKLSPYKTILIVEDEDPIRWALKESLKKEGFNVLEAKNGQEGLDLALKNHPDMILLDLVLPKIFGIDVVKRIRADGGEWGKNALIVILTSLNADGIPNEAKELGVENYFVKGDWKLEEVVGWIKNKLEF